MPEYETSGARRMHSPMAQILDLAIQGAQTLLVLAPALTGLVRKVKLLRRQGPRSCNPIAAWSGSYARRPCWRRAPPGCFASFRT
jgi:hypothetical protein